MPSRLQIECGPNGSPDTSSLEDSDERARSSGKKRALLQVVEETKKLKSNLSNAAIKFATMCDGISKNKNIDYEDKIASLNGLLNDQNSLLKMEPAARARYIKALSTKRDRIVTEMLELEEQLSSK
jgi:hypothetical protein